MHKRNFEYYALEVIVRACIYALAYMHTYTFTTRHFPLSTFARSRTAMEDERQMWTITEKWNIRMRNIENGLALDSTSF